MQENGVDFCFQHRPSSNYYNLKVISPKGEEIYLHSENIDSIEKNLEIIWGHLLKPSMPSMPLPC